MEVAGYLASVLIGVSLGLMGSGGSILTLPVLVYLFKIEPVAATSYSLAIVGVTSLMGATSYLRKKLVDIPAALYFGLPSIITILITRKFLLPAIPVELFRQSKFAISRDVLLMAFFAILMTLAAFSMLKKQRKENLQLADERSYGIFVITGALVGVVTGLVGAGGGFLIIPALINLLRIPVKTAIGTSLIIIATNALAGFSASLGSGSINWLFLLSIIMIAAGGSFLGSYIASKINSNKLKHAFGWFILLMGSYILVKELIL